MRKADLGTIVGGETDVKSTFGACPKAFRSSLTCLLACAALFIVNACGDGGDDDVCAGVTCGDHGTCAVKDGTAVCSCDAGYHAKENDAKSCETDVPDEVKPVTCEGIDCSGHGTCEVKDDAAVCVCDDGYHAKEDDATSCEADEPGETVTCDGIDCDGHGTCEVKDGAAVCVCDEGYHVKENEATSCEADEPGEVSACEGVDCDGHGTCEVKDDAAVCSCDDGYQVKADDPKHCEAVKTEDVVVIKFIEVGDSKDENDIKKKFELKNYQSASTRDMIKDGNDKAVYKAFNFNIGTQEGYFEININNLDINPNDYDDLRVDIDYMTASVSTTLVNSYGLKVYNNVLGDKHPYYMADYYPNGYYKNKNTKGGFYRGYNLVTENLITDDLKKSNKKIKSITIVPYGNLPLKVDEEETYKGAWRKQTTSFIVKSIKIVGYKKGNYKNPYTMVKTTDADELRLNVALRMYDTATVRWIPDIGLKAVRSIGGFHFSDKILYRPGEENYGASYTQRNRVTLEKYASERNDKGVITSIKDAENEQSKDYYGQDCASSVYYSLAKYIPYEAMPGVQDHTWNRTISNILGGLKIKGEDVSTLSVYNELSKVDFNKKAKNNMLSKVPEDVMSRAILESKLRIKSNNSKIKYVKIRPTGEFYDYLLYVSSGVPSGEPLSLMLNNLGISSSNNTIKLTYHKYPSDTDINPVFEINGEKVSSVKQSSISINSYYDSKNDRTVQVYEDSYRLTMKSDKSIDSIKICPYGDNSPKNFRLTSLVIKEESEGNAFGINVFKYILYYGLDKHVITSDEDSSNVNYIKEDFIKKFYSDKELIENTEKALYGSEIDMVAAKYLATQEISKAYSELKIGDVVTTNSSLGGIHIRMITGNTHVVCMDGEVLTVANDKIDAPKGSCDAHGGIDLYKSYYIRTDINSSSSVADEEHKNNYGRFITKNDYVASREWHPNPKYTDLTKLSDLKDKNLNFYIDTKNSFAHALNTAYLPITPKPYETGRVEEPMVLLFDKNTLEDIRSGFKGTLYSNYTIISIDFNIKDRGNNKEHSFVVYPSHAPNYKNTDNDYTKGTFNKEGMFGNYYSLYYNLPDDNAEINKLLTKEILSDDFEITVSVTAGTGEKMVALHLDTRNK